MLTSGGVERRIDYAGETRIRLISIREARIEELARLKTLEHK